MSEEKREKPFWEASRVSLKGIGRATFTKNRHIYDPKKLYHSSLAYSFNLREYNKHNEVKLVGVRPTNYTQLPSRPPLQGKTLTSRSVKTAFFSERRLPVQVVKRYQGGSILTVPVVPLHSEKKSKCEGGIFKEEIPYNLHNALYEESLKRHEQIDIFGIGRNEQVELGSSNIQGNKISVSHLMK